MKHSLLIGVVLLVAFIGGIWAALTIAPPQTTASEPQYRYYQPYPAARELSDFTFNRANGQTLTRADLNGHWTLVFLGYTHCPDICPTTLAALNKVYPQLTTLSPELPVQIMFLSVDPNRDTPERLAAYKAYFNDDFIAATADHGQVFPFVRSIGMMYAISESTEADDYLVDHSGSIVVIGPDATARGRFKPQSSPGQVTIVNSEHIVTDLPQIIQTK